MIRHGYLSSLIFAVCFAFGSQGAVAQDETAVGESARVLEEVMVTARKRDETSHDAPLAISSFSSQDLVDIGATTLEDISLRTPGVQYAEGLAGQFAGRGSSTIRFRGMHSPAQQLATAFVDGIPIMAGLSGLGLGGLERIEVIKGPQSAFFGRSTFGGAINFITRDPGDEFAGEISTEIANMGRYDVSVSHEGPILPGKLSYRITGRKYHTDGPFRSYVDQGKMGEQNTDSIAVAIAYKPTDNFRATARVMRYDDEDGAPAGGLIEAPLHNCWADNGGPLFTPPPDYRGVGPVDYFCGGLPRVRPGPYLALSTGVVSDRGQQLLFGQTGSALWSSPDALKQFKDAPSLDHIGLHRKALRTSLKMAYRFPELGWELSSMTGYNEARLSQVEDNDEEAPLAMFSVSASSREDFFQEVRLSSAVGQRLTWLVGISYFKQDNVGIGFVWLPPFDLFLSNGSVTKTHVKTSAVFGATTFKFTDQINLSLEGRYQEDESDQGFTAGGVRMKKTFPNTMPRVILQYQPIEETNLYLTYAKGNLPGGFNAQVLEMTDDERQQLLDQVGGSAYVGEEELQNFELGWKQRLFNNRMSFDLAAYYMIWKNQQTTVQAMLYNPSHPNADPTTGLRPIQLTVGAGKTDLWGIEFAADALVGNYGKVGMTFNWAASEYKVFYCGFVERFTGSTDCAGNSSPRYPEYSGSVFASYTRPISDQWTGFVRGEAIYFGKAFVDESNLAWTKSYTTTQLRLGAETDTFRVEVWAKNLLDSYFYTGGSRQSSYIHGFDFSQQGVTVVPDVGRQIGLTAIYKF